MNRILAEVLTHAFMVVLAAAASVFIRNELFQTLPFIIRTYGVFVLLECLNVYLNYKEFLQKLECSKYGKI